MIDWGKTTKEEMEVINKIANRATELLGSPKLETSMDIEACHTNGCPLNLQKLLNADNFNFAHDICGINRHLNRQTGELENCFLPRCAV